MRKLTLLALLILIAAVWFWGCIGTGKNTASSRPPMPPKQYRITASQRDHYNVSSVAFSPDGKYVLAGLLYSSEPLSYTSPYITITYKFFVSVWDLVTGRRINIFRQHKGKVNSVCFSPDGTQALSGSDDKTVRLWNIEDGREIRVFQHDDAVTSVCFSPNGKQVLSGSRRTVLLWDIEDNRKPRVFQHEKEVTAISFNSDGTQILSGSMDFAIHLWDTESGREIRHFPGHLDKITSVSFNHDGSQILSGSSDMTVRLWDISSGKEIRMDKIQKTRNDNGAANIYVIFSPDEDHIFAGYSGNVYIFDVASDEEIKVEFVSPRDHSLSISSDGKQFIVASYDINLYNISTGKRIVCFIDYIDNYTVDTWVVYTSDHFYNTSPGGEDFFGVYESVYNFEEYNNRWKENWDKLDKYKARALFYNPQKVEARLQGRFDESMQSDEAIPSNTSVEPPVVVIRSPENKAELSSAQVILSVSVVDPKNPIKVVKILINGEPVGSDDMKGISGSKGMSVTAAGLTITGDENRVDFRLPITLNAGRNRIEVLASNAYSESREAVEVSFTPTGSDIPPNLWILSIGVNRYADKDLNDLGYAVNDARAIIDIFKAQEGKLYHKVYDRLIADDADIKPTKDQITDNFAWLKQAAQRDTVLLFIAGHGVNDEGGNFWFMPSDAAFNPDGSIRLSRAISYREIHTVFDMRGQKKLVFIDTCHSEGTSGKKARSMDNNQLVNSLKNDTYDTTVILASSQGSELSLESDDYKHGLFTYAIIQGLKGEADLFKDGSITITELNTYVSGTVPRLSNGHQHPTIYIPSSYSDFAVVDLK